MNVKHNPIREFNSSFKFMKKQGGDNVNVVPGNLIRDDVVFENTNLKGIYILMNY